MTNRQVPDFPVSLPNDEACLVYECAVVLNGQVDRQLTPFVSTLNSHGHPRGVY